MSTDVHLKGHVNGEPVWGGKGIKPVVGNIDPRDLAQATPEEIAQSREDGNCPRCGAVLDMCDDGALCEGEECGFTF